MNNGLKKAAAHCYIFNNGKVLMLKRTKEPHLGQYIPVGGKLEPYENPTVFILREVAEETGIRLKKVKQAGILTETSPVEFNWINYVFVAECSNTEVTNCNEGKLEWVPLNKIRSVPIPEVNHVVLEKIAKGEYFAFNAIYNKNIKLIEVYDDVTGQKLL